MAADPITIGSTHATSPPRTSSGPPTQEIRIAVVMYGGISLCIYIHGVAQELLRLVRATSGADVGDDEVTQIYKEMSDSVRDQGPDGDMDPPLRSPTRFVVDLLSGTSAGGINAVFLAKALALQSKDLKRLRQTWLETADMNTILNRRGFSEPKRSLLDGNLMYRKLYEAFRDMNSGPFDVTAADAPVEQIDLFVTTTDLNGVSIPIRLADLDVPEKVHKGCFHFRWDNIVLAKDSKSSELDIELDRLRRRDFEAPFDAMLAFAARCTSSFPIAFAPMKLADIKPVIGKDAYRANEETYSAFFRWIPVPALIPPKNPLAIDERELADGGYLDNKPFDYVINALGFRATRLRHTRKLFFVDPFPEIAGDASDQPHFNFVQNAIAGSITLPHYQTIRQEIDRVKVSNGIQARLKALQEAALPPAVPVGRFRVDSVQELVAEYREYGSMYRSYHAVRLLDCTDDLARTLCGLPAWVLSEDAFLAVRYLVRAWRLGMYAPDRRGGRQPEAQFFDDFDFSFRMRRAAYLLEWAQEHNKSQQLRDALITHLTRLHRRREQLSLPTKRNPIWPLVLDLRRAVNRYFESKGLKEDAFQWILRPGSDAERQARADDLYEAHREQFHGIADTIKTFWTQVFAQNRAELQILIGGDADLETEYQRFDYLDMVSLGFLEGSNVSEHTETEIYRISPADGIQRSLADKLAGYKVEAFGAFLKREWRQNDILWGRLDTCERIVSAVLNHEKDEKIRNCFVTRLQNAIVRQEATMPSAPDLTCALQAIADKDLQAYLQDRYKLPGDPPPKESARQIAEATDIFGRMIEEDAGVKNRAIDLFRRAGGIAAQLVGLLTPGTLRRVFWNYWVALLGVMGAVLWVFASIVRDNHAKTLGEYGIGAALLIWVLSWISGTLLAGVKTPGLLFVFRAVRWLPGLVLFALVVIGALHVPQTAQDLWHRILGMAGGR
ncbi:MAG TPA: patatin-like protein [bacterium]|nr:patatin-like protein [bacterium]